MGISVASIHQCQHQQSDPDHYGALPVGSYAPNALGLHDTHGNLAEWTLDRYNGRLRGGSLVDPLPYEEGRRVVGSRWELGGFCNTSA